MARGKRLISILSRSIVAVLLIPIVVFCILNRDYNGVYLSLLMLVIGVTGIIEFNTAIRLKLFPYGLLAILSYIVSVFLFFVSNLDIEIWSFILKNTFSLYIMLSIGFIFAMLGIFAFSKDFSYNMKSIVYNIFIYFYLSLGIGHIIMLYHLKGGSMYLLYVVVNVWIFDTFSYIGGSLFGKRKLGLASSPNKSIAGLISGFIGVGISSDILNRAMKLSLPYVFVLSLVIGFLAFVGDLSMSAIKRSASIKDFSKILLGHGGILDRLDSILFCVVVFYYFVVIVNRINVW